MFSCKPLAVNVVLVNHWGTASARIVGGRSADLMRTFAVWLVVCGCALAQQDILEGCEDTCQFANDGECDDGGPGSVLAACRLGTDFTDCRVCRDVSSLPVRELGYKAHPGEQPKQGIGSSAEFIADATFEQCAALCGANCAGFVRRNVGTNCWLIPLQWSSEDSNQQMVVQIDLTSWTGGTTYLKLTECLTPELLDGKNYTTILGVPFQCEEYAVKNILKEADDGYEYAVSRIPSNPSLSPIVSH